MKKAMHGLVDMRCKIDKSGLQKFRADTPFTMVDRFFAEMYQSAAEGLPDGAVEDSEWHEQEKNIEKLADAMGHFDQLRPELWQRLWSDAPGLPVRHLPPGRVHDLFLQYHAWHEEHSMEQAPASWSTFWRCWSLKWHHVLAFRSKSQHSRCNTCHLLGERLHAERGDLVKKMDYARQLRAHLRDQYADRTLYWSMRWASRMHMDVLVVIIDSMDKTKFGIPRFNYHRLPKWLDKTHRPKLTCTLGIAHGWSTSNWLADETLPHGANAFAEILFRLLEQVQQIAARTGRHIPRHLWIQSDNTPAQAKNAETSMTLAWLVGSGKFDSISLNFLPVGHTHEDIDQFFSLIAGLLCRQKTFQTPAEVANIIKINLGDHVSRKNEAWSSEILTTVRDFGRWLDPLKVKPYNTFKARKGMDSCRSFTFKLGMDLNSSEASMLQKEGETRMLRDVYCCVKASMHDLNLYQAPVLLLPDSRLSRVQSSVCI